MGARHISRCFLFPLIVLANSLMADFYTEGLMYNAGLLFYVALMIHALFTLEFDYPQRENDLHVASVCPYKSGILSVVLFVLL